MFWRDEYSLGILEIDNQHKVLMHSFSTIEKAIGSGQALSTVDSDVADLKDSMRFSFQCEEALMRLFGYPEIRLHTAEHTHFFRVFSEMESNSIRTPNEQELVKFLRVWLTRHIVGSDRGFAQHILTGAAVTRS
jgi:hemerythrin